MFVFTRFWDIVYDTYFSPVSDADATLQTGLDALKRELLTSRAVPNGLVAEPVATTLKRARPNANSKNDNDNNNNNNNDVGGSNGDGEEEEAKAVEQNIQLLRKQLALQQMRNVQAIETLRSVVAFESALHSRSRGSSTPSSSLLHNEQAAAAAGAANANANGVPSVSVSTSSIERVMLPQARLRKNTLFRMYQENLKWASVVGSLCRGMRDDAVERASAGLSPGGVCVSRLLLLLEFVSDPCGSNWVASDRFKSVQIGSIKSDRIGPNRIRPDQSDRAATERNGAGCPCGAITFVFSWVWVGGSEGRSNRRGACVCMCHQI